VPCLLMLPASRAVRAVAQRIAQAACAHQA
jgi:hypothetical protein